jgi:hypothetical protein
VAKEHNAGTCIEIFTAAAILQAAENHKYKDL